MEAVAVERKQYQHGVGVQQVVNLNIPTVVVYVEVRAIPEIIRGLHYLSDPSTTGHDLSLMPPTPGYMYTLGQYKAHNKHFLKCS